MCKTRLREGALSPENTPTIPPAPQKLVPLSYPAQVSYPVDPPKVNPDGTVTEEIK